MWLTSQAKLAFSVALVMMPVLFLGCAPAQVPVAGTGEGPNVVESGSSTKPPSAETDGTTTQSEKNMTATDGKDSMKTATFGAGCFWCVEAVFQRLEGVEAVVSGYMGGQLENPTYEQICTGKTGHAEVISITYDESKLSFDTLLEVFWKTHDPTTLNRQGNDVGTQYRSAVFYHDDNQKNLAESYKKKLNDAKAFPNPIVTEVVAAGELYKAEQYHQNFWNEKGQGNGYCQAVIPPKLEKLKKIFGDKLKK